MKETLERNANIMEMYFGLELERSAICKATGLSIFAIDEILSFYDKPIDCVIQTISKVNMSNKHWYAYENWNRLPIQQIAEVLALSTITVKGIAYKYGFPKKKRICLNPVRPSYRNRVILLNTETGIFYLSEKEAAKTINMVYSVFKCRMNGHKKNTTKFIKL